ncbi:hypothetical protein M8J76_004558 [Diaphorina citri]|nr:hypothetical protein M8J75_001489 [Diaphorina citri]KAI5719063.1 hypothetical protein M8J76_004558 [Diaphorina citri]KAI5721309.1 hypothetical protein M8J77_019019 [Diaphorina citri]
MNKGSVIFFYVIICSIVKQGYLYTEYLLENDNVCSILFDKRILNLGYENKSGIIIRENFLKGLSGKHAWDCLFTVRGGSAGVIAVIQQMKFRTNRTEGHNASCIDFVQFSPADKTILSQFNIELANSKKWSEPFCGEVNLSGRGGKNLPASEGKGVDVFHEDSLIGQNTYVDPNGLVDVKIHIGSQPIQPSDNLRLEIAFTSFQDCKYDMGSYRKCGGPICIWREYFEDSIVNCPFVECTDENLCGSDSNDHKGIATGLGTKVLLGAVAGIFTMVFVLIIFFWTFHYCGFLCSPKPPRHLAELTIIEEAPRPPSCTPLNAAPAPQEEKDLPPAYETLFPSAPLR